MPKYLYNIIVIAGLFIFAHGVAVGDVLNAPTTNNNGETGLHSFPIITDENGEKLYPQVKWELPSGNVINIQTDANTPDGEMNFMIPATEFIPRDSDANLIQSVDMEMTSGAGYPFGSAADQDIPININGQNFIAPTDPGAKPGSAVNANPPDNNAAQNQSYADTTQSTAPQNNQPQCAATLFAASLRANANDITESDPEHIIRGWIYKSFQDPGVLKRILLCPEIAKIPDEETVKFPTIEYVFAGGRRIVVNYETQPKIIKQRISVGDKKSLPDTNPSPRVGGPGDSTIWTNTDPAWYGILVVQSGTMDAFIGDDKNNTISLKYIEQNINKIYPIGSGCTSKSALANDSDIVNIAAHKTVQLEDGDTNDYYVAGDANLQWITWAEVALDVAITVATVGGGTAILGATKAARASKVAKNLIGTVKNLEKIDSVKDYISATRRAAQITDDLKKIDRATDAAKYAAKADDLKKANDSLRAMNAIDDVKKYKKATDNMENLMKWRRAMRSWKTVPQRGNVIARTFKSMRAVNTGNKTIGRAAKSARAGMKSGKTRDWLFHSTMKNIGVLAKIERTGGIIYGAITFVGNMYDWTETSTGDFTSNLDFKPLGLLSADDLTGQENIINHGMWLMWAGDSVNPADDDAAYLQAMDFAAKFHQDLMDVQEDTGTNVCAVDIFVVRPIIRNPDSDNAQLYYLIMNDTPWSTDQN